MSLVINYTFLILWNSTLNKGNLFAAANCSVSFSSALVILCYFVFSYLLETERYILLKKGKESKSNKYIRCEKFGRINIEIKLCPILYFK